MDMYSYKHFAAFSHAALKSIQVDLTKSLKGMTHQKNREFLDHLIDGGDFKPPTKNLSAVQRYRFKCFYSFVEIHSAIESLDLSERFLMSFPSGCSNFSKKEYLQHHVESYLGNTYILRERLCALTNFYQKNKMFTEAQAKNINKTIIDNYDKIFPHQGRSRNIRNAHIHDARFENNDLKRLGTWELILKFEGAGQKNAELIKAAKFFEKKVSKKTKETFYTYIVEKNKSIMTLVNAYFELINKECLYRKKFKLPNLS